jgi:hypothetical protein
MPVPPKPLYNHKSSILRDVFHTSPSKTKLGRNQSKSAKPNPGLMAAMFVRMFALGTDFPNPTKNLDLHREK